MASGDGTTEAITKNGFQEMCDFVDKITNDEYISEEPRIFWKIIFTDISKQQMFLKCLIYKNLAFARKLGNKPLRDTMQVIKKIYSQEKPPSIMDNIRPSSDANQPSAYLPDVSPQKRGRAQSSQPRKISNDPRAPLITNRYSIQPLNSNNQPHSRVKRKSSDNINEDQFGISNAVVLYNDYAAATKIRNLLYTISYLTNTCDINKWDFNDLREIFLIWNKARSWDQVSCTFEHSLMKRISRPPDLLSEEERWEQIITDLLNSYHFDEADENNKYLNHQHVGNSIKYVAMRYKIYQNQSSITSLIEAIISILNKMYAKQEESKILSLLHLFCETVITAPYVPIMLLQRAYSAVRHLFLLPLPVSATVKEVLDLIQIEMKSPGYFRRTIYFQEKDFGLFSNNASPVTSASATNVFVDKGKESWDNMESALADLAQRCSFMSSSSNEFLHQQLVIEHIFTSVFGNISCDISTLRRALQAAAEPKLQFIYNDAASIMEQAVSMDNPQQAQEYIRQNLERISNALLEDDDRDPETPQEENKTIIQESASDPGILTKSQSLEGNSSANGSSLLVPKRNNSFLSRAVSSESCSFEKQASQLGLNANTLDTPCSPAADKMDYAQIIMKNFDKDQLSDAIFELVRTTAKEFVSEKRKSGGAYSSARRKYLEKKRYNQLASEEMEVELAEEQDVGSIDGRDSGLVDDFTEGEASRDIKKAGHGDGPSANTGEFWRKFSQEGFSHEKTRINEDETDNLSKPLRLSGISLDDEKNETSEAETTKATASTEIKRSKSAVANLSLSLSVKPPFSNDHITATPDRAKSLTSRKQKIKKSVKTLSRIKGIIIVNKMRKSPSTKKQETTMISDVTPSEKLGDMIEASSGENVEYSPVSPSTKFGSVGSLPPPTSGFNSNPIRWRTTSLPVKNSIKGKKKETRKRGHIKDFFSSATDVRMNSQQNVTPLNRCNSSSPSKSINPSMSKSRSFDILGIDDEAKTEFPVEDQTDDLPSLTRLSSDPGKIHGSPESRHRMDSGILADRSSDDGSLVSPAHNRTCGDWEDTGVAGVKFIRKHALKRNRKSKSSPSQHSLGKMSKRKVLKLAFVGNDKTVGDAARAYYELRRRQMTRAPLLHQIDLRLYYIPVGEHVFADETAGLSSVTSPFDLEIAKMIGSFDPWYRSVVAHTTNNLIRVKPSIYKDEEETNDNLTLETCFCPIPTADKALASSILSYFRFAIKTSYVPIYKATMRTSSEEEITEVFCCRAEIGNIAYKQAIAAGRFGKMGKLVDLSDDKGPPAAYTSFKYKKYGINGSFLMSKTLDEAYYFTASFVPIALSGSNKDQARYPGADGLSVTLQDNDKRMKLLKRGTKVSSQEWEAILTRFTASEAKMEVVRPVQGTFTVSLDHTLIHTNIKSFEVSRCLAPEFERPNSKKRRIFNSSHVMSLPLKTFWPNTNLA